MSWGALIGLGGAAYVLKALGPVVLGRRELSGRTGDAVDLIAIPLLGALIVTQTFATGERLVFDARIPAVAVAALLVWRGAPFLLVVLGAAGCAAGLRLLGAA